MSASDEIPADLLKLMERASRKKPREDAVELLDLLCDLSEVDLPPALWERVQKAKEALLSQAHGGNKGGNARAAELAASNTLKKQILAEAEAYKGDKRKRASFIGQKLRLSGSNAASYVRKVLREAGQ